MKSSFIHYHLDIDEININPDDVLDMIHEADRSLENPVVYEVIQVFEQLRDLANICGGYATFDEVEVLQKEGMIKINDRDINPQSKVCGYMKGAEKIAVFICTAGAGFTEYSKRYNDEGDYLKGYVVDTYGSIVVEKAIDFIQGELEKQELENGLYITNRYSPGYCNWQVSDQKKLFSLLPDNNCGISLSESCLMRPIKSVSGIIGIGKNVEKKSYACDICSNITCIYRKVKDKNINH